MIYLKKFKHKSIILNILILLLFSNISFSISYNQFQVQTSNTKQLLLDTWNVVTGKNESSDVVNIPYFIGDKNINSVEFKKIFSISDTINYSKVRLWILGLHGYALIYLNDNLLREHINLPTSYYIDIDPIILKKENNVLNIKLNNFDDNGKTFDLRYPNYAKQFRPLGIAREIYLEYLPKKYLDNIDIKYKNKNIFLNYKLNITDSAKSIIERTVKVEEEIISPVGTTVFKRFEYFENKTSIKTIKRQVSINFPKEWNLESPDLYKLRLTIKSGTDNYFEFNSKFGLRVIKSLGSKLLLNNNPINIKGINYRFNFSNGLNYLKQSLNDLKTIKSTGFNSVRFVNYPPHPSLASLADSIGLYLFVDNGLWRLPSSYYANNKYFNEGKTIIKEIGETFSIHPSVIGIGIGNETNIFLSNEKKFTIVLKKYLSDNFNFLTYISPIDYSVKSPNKLCDFILMQNYVNPEKLFIFAQESQFLNTPIVLGNIHFPQSIYLYSKIESHRLNKLKRFFAHYDSLNVFNGYFVESYNDWLGEIPNLYTINTENNNYTYPYGIVDLNRNEKDKFHFFKDYLKDSKIQFSSYKSDQKNNFQSLIVFIIAIVFFLIYKRSYRLKENLTRSIQHPYGFFVDLRDRRIISVFNSTLMGITVGTIVSSFLSSIVYAFHTSILFDEYVNIFIPNIQNKLLFLSIVESPWKLFILIFITLSLIQLLFSFLLKFLGIFSKEKRKFRQIYSIISWSGSPLLFFIPIAIFAFNFAANDIFYPEILWLFFLFIVWYNFRIANGFRILYLIQPAKMIVLVFLTYLILIISFLVYINVDIEVFDYIKTLSAAQNLY